MRAFPRTVARLSYLTRPTGTTAAHTVHSTVHVASPVHVRTATKTAIVPAGRFRRSREDYAAMFQRGTDASTRDGFWLEAASKLSWYTEPTVALDDTNPPFYKWFPDGVINTCYNALDRHVEGGRGDQTALRYHSAVGGPSREISYTELLSDVSRFAGKMQELGVEAGDRVVVCTPPPLHPLPLHSSPLHVPARLLPLPCHCAHCDLGGPAHPRPGHSPTSTLQPPCGSCRSTCR